MLDYSEIETIRNEIRRGRLVRSDALNEIARWIGAHLLMPLRPTRTPAPLFDRRELPV